MATPTYVKRLESGYWHVRFGPQCFVQWPIGRVPAADDVFGGDDQQRERVAEQAELEVRRG